MIILKCILENYRDYFTSLWTKDSKMELHPLRYYIFWYLFWGATIAFFNIFTQVLLAFLILSVAKHFHSSLLISILRSPMKWFNKTASGEIVSRFGEDQEVLDNRFRWRLREFAFCTSFAFLTFIFIMWVIPFFSFICIPIILILFFYYGRKFYMTYFVVSELVSEQSSKTVSQFNETLTGIVTIRGFGKQKEFIMENKSIISKRYQLGINGLDIDQYICCRGRFLTLLILFIFMVFSAFTNYVDPDTFGFVITKLFAMLFDLVWIIFLIPGIQQDFISFEKIRKYCGNESENYNGKTPKNFPLEGKIEFKNVTFAYDTQEEKQKKKNVLNNISFTINPGEKCGLIGITGSGKSTTIQLLFRLYEIEKGKILIDGQDTKTISLGSIRTNICYISQNPQLFKGTTIKENIDPTGQFSDYLIQEVLEQTGIKKRINSLKNGINTKVDDIKFSSGEKQLLLFARALLIKSKILVLDEATASCDNKTDSHIQDLIREKFKDSTCLTVAHRLETIADYDRIIGLKNGVVFDNASPRELIEDDTSLFFKMCQKLGEKRLENLKKLIK